jgi:hypothetical protein
MSELEGNAFNFAAFHARRVRRIFPAFIVVLSASLAKWLCLLEIKLPTMPSPQSPFMSARVAQQISYEQSAHLSDLPKAGGPSISWLHPYVEAPPISPLLFPELASRQILEQHQWGPVHTQGIGLGVLPNALVSGNRSWAMRKACSSWAHLFPPT